MPTATAVVLAEAVKDLLNAQPFSLSFAARRPYVPVYQLQEMETLRVDVVPNAYEQSRLDRSGWQEAHAIDVGVQQRVKGLEDPVIDQLMGLMQEIRDYLRDTRIASPQALVIGLENAPVYDPESLEQKQLFVSVLTVTYRVFA